MSPREKSIPFARRFFTLFIILLMGAAAQVTAQTTWTGNVSTAWNVAGNWSAGIPDANDDVLIPVVTNLPVISAAGAVARSVTVHGTLTINAAGTLSINGNPAEALSNAGTVQNSGTINIGNTSGGFMYGIDNGGQFNNNAGGKINVDNVGIGVNGQSEGVRNINTGTFNNGGTITIGGIANGLMGSGGLYGMRNYGMFNNHPAGVIRVDKVMHHALGNYLTFTNEGQIILGSAPVSGSNLFNTGLSNGRDFINTSTGRIRIDNYSEEAIDASAHGVFDNSGSIRIGEFSGGASVLTGDQNGLLNNKTGGVFEATGNLATNRFVAQGGTLSPGISGGSATAGWISFTTGIDLSNSIFAIDVNGKGSPGVHYDQIGVNGIVKLGGTLALSFNSYTGAAGDQVVILTSNGIQGKFSTVTGLPAGWQINYTATEVILSYGQITGYNVWTGNANFSWTNAANWSKAAIPSMNDDVLIPAGTPNNCLLGGAAGRARSVTVLSGATLTINGAGILQINGSDKQGIDNQGTVTNNGTISIGNTSSTGFHGIVNAGTFNNGSTGKINIDRASLSAFFARENNINNAGNITVGAIAYIQNLILADGAGLFNNNTGGIFKGAGDIYVNRFVNAGGTLSPGAPVGTISFSGAKGFDNTILDIEVKGTLTPGVDFDQIGVSGAAVLGGTLNLTVNYTPASGDEITFLTGTSVSGAFTTVNLPAGWSIQYLANAVKLTYGQNYWTGNVSTNWHTAGNWSLGAVPTASESVIIPDVANDPVISAGAATAQTVTVLNGGLLTINASRTLTINGAPAQGFLNEGAVQNSGTITIGNTAPVGMYGILNKGSFTNYPGAVINVDRVEPFNSSGILNEVGKTFTNQGIIRIGAVAGKNNNNYGLNNDGIFTNSSGAKIFIDRFTWGLYHQSYSFQHSFTNHGEIIIGGDATGTTLGYGMDINYEFTNAADGKISIDRISGTGISVDLGPDFINHGAITFGKSAPVPTLINISSIQSSFRNMPGALIEGSGSIINKGLFENAGGTVAPAWSAAGNSSGRIVYDANMDFSNSMLIMTVSGASTAGGDYDQILVDGSIILGGTLHVTVNYTPIPGDEIIIISSTNTSGTSISGTFSTTSIPTGWTLSYTTNAVKLVFGNNDSTVWTGTVSNAWTTPGNWTNGIPVAGTIVVIPDVARDPVISTATAIAGSVTVQSGGLLTINTAASLLLNGTAAQSILNLGTVQNNGTINIGNMAARVTNVVRNEGSFNNNTGSTIIIARAFENTETALLNVTGTFINSGSITIGGTGFAGKYGVSNAANFQNNAAGQITIGLIDSTAIQNKSGTFTNAGSISFGATAGSAQYGVYNAASFNNPGGQLHIDRTTSAGVYNVTGTFTNTGIIRIGANAASGVDGIYNKNTFNNNAGGEIYVDRVSNAGIRSVGYAPLAFNNAGRIAIGSLSGGNLFNTGIHQESLFNNNGGEIRINRVTSGLFLATYNFDNAGLIDIGGLTTVQNLVVENGGLFYQDANGELRGAGNFDRLAGNFTRPTGKFSPGNPVGRMVFDWHIDLGGSIIAIDVNGNTPGLSYDQLISAGQIDLDNTATLMLNVNYAGAEGDQLTIISGLSISDKFATVTGLPEGWELIYTATSVILKRYSSTTWTGAVNTDWINAGNWTAGVPADKSIVIIPNVSNDPILNTASAALGILTIQPGGQLTVEAAGTLTVNGNGTQDILNEGTLINNGTVTIGNVSPIVTYFLINKGTLTNNATGQVIVAQVAPNAEAAIFNNGGNMLNSGSIIIGSVAAAGRYGIINAGQFTSASGSQIGIGRITEAALSNNSGTFLNDGAITLGTYFNSDSKYGLYNNASFQNNGDLIIQHVTTTNLYHLSQTFTNTGTIRIGVDGYNGSDGINNAAVFINETAGSIYIDRNTNSSIYHHGPSFTNKGLISINSLNISGYATLWGIYIDQPFNNSGGQIFINRVTSGIAVNASTFTNTGAVTTGNLTSVATLLSNRGSGTFSNSTNGEFKGTGSIDAARFANAGGKLSPGYTAAGSLIFAGNETFTNAIINIKVNGAGTAGVNYDQVVVNGTATISGSALHVSINYSPAVGDRITVLSATSLSGAFNTITGLPPTWSVTYEANAAILVCESLPPPIATSWTGAVSSAWEVAGNWTAGVPGDVTDVTIPDVTNDPVISTTTALAKSIVIRNGAVLTLNGSATLTINNSTTQALLNQGTVLNSGTIHIGNTQAVGNYGIRNDGSFDNKATGKLNIDRASGLALYNASGNFTNSGIITIGSNAAAGTYGFQNHAIFNNNAGAQLNIDRAGTSAFYNVTGTFTNAGRINIGGNFATGADGLDNDGTFHNNTGAQIIINRVTSAGIYSNGIDFVNKGTITIGDLSGGNTFNYGIYVDGQLDNDGGAIHIDRVNTALTVSTDHLYNTGIINIGGLTSVPTLLSASGSSMLFNDLNGELRGTGTIAAARFESFGGKLLPGNATAGKITFTGNESFSNAILNIQVNGNGTPGVNFDQVEVQGTATLGGTLALTMNYAGAAGDQITILTATAVTGTFNTVTGLTTNWQLKYTPTAVVLEYDPTHYWTGNVSPAWNTAGNWSRGVVPGAGQNVVLPAIGPVRELTVTIGANIANIEIAAGRTVTINAAGSITATNSFINNGTIKGQGRIVNAHFTNTGTIAPGLSPGTLSITGNFTNQGTIQAEIGGTTAGTEYDQLAVSGSITLGGNLVITHVNGFFMSAGQSFTILTGTSITGTFASVTWPPLVNGIVTYATNAVTLHVTSVVPLTLLEFTGHAAGEKVVLKWKTAQEENTSHFEIERSVDGQQYSVTGSVDAAGRGANSYTFTDENPVNGYNYYRLKMVDKDGKFTHSPVVTVKFANKEGVKIAPNPASSFVILTITDRSLFGQQAQVFSPVGSLVARVVLNSTTRLEIAHLPAGIYTIKTTTGSYRFVKK